MKWLVNAFQNLLHIGAIRTSGLFQSEAYRTRYLTNKAYAPYPLLHYLLIGEAKDYRPNAFFDPAFCRERNGTQQLWRHLAEKRLWNRSTSSFFDGAFYRERTGRPAEDVAPLVDFWRRGFDADVDGSEALKLAFFRRATTRDIWDKKAAAFFLLTGSDDCVFTAEELQRRQDRFYNHIDMSILKECPPNSIRKNLVFVQAGRTYAGALLRDRRDFDVMLNYYEETSEADNGCDIAIVQRGTKVTAIRKILEHRPELLLRYAYVLFLDDDVEISSATIEKFFVMMEAEGLDLAQPSLTPESITYFEDLKQPGVGPGVRPLTSVEIMMPALSRRALETCGWTFSAGVSGWAIDFLLGHEIKKAFSTRPAVIGACVAKHLRPFDTENGSFYRFLKSHGIDPNVEAGAISLRYGIDDSSAAITLID